MILRQVEKHSKKDVDRKFRTSRIRCFPVSITKITVSSIFGLKQANNPKTAAKNSLKVRHCSQSLSCPSFLRVFTTSPGGTGINVAVYFGRSERLLVM